MTRIDNKQQSKLEDQKGKGSKISQNWAMEEFMMNWLT